MTKKYPDPKRLDYSRAMLWQGLEDDSFMCPEDRSRVITKHGAWWDYDSSFSCHYLPPYLMWNPDPCWYQPGMTPRQQVAAMKAYDKRERRTTIFLGYLA